jgi:hypothetical protein
MVRIIAIGDIHGDSKLVIRCFIIANLIRQVFKENKNTIEFKNKLYEWIGEDAIVLQVGDQVDRCRPYNDKFCINPETTFDDEASDQDILFFFNNLNKVAEQNGGEVVSVLGNHEIMNVRGDENDYNYVSYLGLKEYTPPGEEVTFNWRKIKFSRGNGLAKMLAKTRKVVDIRNGYLFAHAGVIDSFLKYYEKFKIPLDDIIDTLNDDIKKWLENEKLTDKKLLKRINYVINNYSSPIWVRTLGNLPNNLNLDDEQCNDVNIILKKLDLKGMIVGHTPQIIGINATCGAKLFRVDVGSSRAFEKIMDSTDNRKPQVLEILDDGSYNIIVDV